MASGRCLLTILLLCQPWSQALASSPRPAAGACPVSVLSLQLPQGSRGAMWRAALLDRFFGTGFGARGIKEAIIFYDMDRLDAPAIGAFV